MCLGEHFMATRLDDAIASADLIIGSARIPVSVIDVTEQGAAIELKGKVKDFAGAALHIHGIGHLPIALHRHMQGRIHVLGFSKPTARTKKKLCEHVENQNDLIGPAIDYIVTRKDY